jgi:mRNA-degrading endonuclease RelE of RelBE toxin-antitoxin system
MPKLRFTQTAEEDLKNLQADPSKKKILKAVLKTLGQMETNLKHPSLNSHEFKSLKGPRGEKVFEVYAQQNTPGAYRIFWYYGPEKNCISIIAIVQHP